VFSGVPEFVVHGWFEQSFALSCHIDCPVGQRERIIYGLPHYELDLLGPTKSIFIVNFNLKSFTYVSHIRH